MEAPRIGRLAVALQSMKRRRELVGERTDLVRGVMQPDELAVHVELVDADAAGGGSRVSDADAAAGFRFFDVHTLSLATCGANAATGRGPGHGHT